MKRRSFISLFLISLFVHSVCYAALTSTQKSKVDEALKDYAPPPDPSRAVVGAFNVLKFKPDSLKELPTDTTPWRRVLLAYPYNYDEKIEPVEGESELELAERIRKNEVLKNLQEDLRAYLVEKFSNVALGSCVGPEESKNPVVDELVADTARAFGAMETKEGRPALTKVARGGAEGEMRPPYLTVASLFSEAIISHQYAGWDVKGESIIKLMKWPQTGLRQDLLSKLGRERQDVLLFPVNVKPVRLTKETVDFFEGLPETDRVLDGSKMAYKLYFYPQSLLHKGDIGEPIPFYLMKDVSKDAKEDQFLNFGDSERWKKPLEDFNNQVKKNGEQFKTITLALDHIKQGLVDEKVWAGVDSGISMLESLAIPTEGSGAVAGQASLELARVFRMQGNKKREKQYLRLAADRDDHPIAQWELGVLLKEEGNLVEAEKYLRRAADRHNMPKAQNDLGVMLEGQGNITDAQKYLRLASDRHDDPDAQNNLGVLYENRGNLKEAVGWYEKAAKKYDAKAFLNLGILCTKYKAQCGSISHAEVIDYLKKAIEHSPQKAKAGISKFKARTGISKLVTRVRPVISEFLLEMGRMDNRDNTTVINAMEEALR